MILSGRATFIGYLVAQNGSRGAFRQLARVRAEGELEQRVPAETAARVGEAVRFAITWHGDQRRPTGVDPWFARWYAACQQDFADLA